MVTRYVSISMDSVQLVDDTGLSTDDLARGCEQSAEWVQARVEEGLLEGERLGSQWRFSAVTLVRARRIALLERCFDADPQLAALTTDLIEEVARLRRALEACGRDGA